MKRVIMSHPENSRRSKHSTEVAEMISQYQSQILTCKNQLSLKLMTQKLEDLKKLVETE